MTDDRAQGRLLIRFAGMSRRIYLGRPLDGHDRALADEVDCTDEALWAAAQLVVDSGHAVLVTGPSGGTICLHVEPLVGAPDPTTAGGGKCHEDRSAPEAERVATRRRYGLDADRGHAVRNLPRGRVLGENSPLRAPRSDDAPPFLDTRSAR